MSQLIKHSKIMEYSCADYLYKLQRIDKDTVLMNFAAVHNDYVIVLLEGQIYTGYTDKKLSTNKIIYSAESYKKIRNLNVLGYFCEITLYSNSTKLDLNIISNLSQVGYDVWMKFLPRNVTISNTKVISNVYIVSYEGQTKFYNNNTQPYIIHYKNEHKCNDQFVLAAKEESQILVDISCIIVCATERINKCPNDLTDDELDMFVPLASLEGHSLEFDKQANITWGIKTPYVGTLTLIVDELPSFIFTDDFNRRITYTATELWHILPHLICGSISGEFDYVCNEKGRKTLRYVLRPRANNDSIIICIGDDES